MAPRGARRVSDLDLLDEFDGTVPNGITARPKGRYPYSRGKLACTVPTVEGMACRGNHISIHNGKAICNAHMGMMKRR